MTTYVLLLRGVMPSGKNRLPMSRLREVLGEAGYSRVRTYIQSGNVLVDTALNARQVETGVRALISDRIGPDLIVMARTGPRMEDVLKENPFHGGYDISRVFFVSFLEPVPESRADKLRSRDFSPETLAFCRNADTAYMVIPGPYGRGTLSGSFLERAAGIPATVRNFNTMQRLAAMSRE